MRAVIQRSKAAKVISNSKILGHINKGLVVFLGIGNKDTSKDVVWMAEKIINLRIFSDENGKMNLSLAETGQEMLIVSQFTLYGDCRKGRRPGYSASAPPDIAEPLYNSFIEMIESKNIQTAAGIFGADMQVELINDGPVTLLIDSEKEF